MHRTPSCVGARDARERAHRTYKCNAGRESQRSVTRLVSALLLTMPVFNSLAKPLPESAFPDDLTVVQFMLDSEHPLRQRPKDDIWSVRSQRSIP